MVFFKINFRAPAWYVDFRIGWDVFGNWRKISYYTTVRTEIIGHHARTLELPLLVRSVSQVRAESESSRGVFPPNPEGGILDVLAPCPIISVLTVLVFCLGVVSLLAEMRV